MDAEIPTTAREDLHPDGTATTLAEGSTTITTATGEKGFSLAIQLNSTDYF